jgi:hypothetical protein
MQLTQVLAIAAAATVVSANPAVEDIALANSAE